MNFDPGLVTIIIGAGLLGMPLDFIIRKIKEKFNISGIWIYGIEILVCCGATGAYLLSIQGWDLTLFGIYSALVFASIHGWYVAKKKN